MVKRLQTSFIRNLERCQKIEAWSFTVQGLGTAWTHLVVIFRNGGSTSIVRTVIYQRDKFVQCYEASSFCYRYLASKVARCNISSNTKETNMHAIASQWLTDQSKYVLPLFQNKCLNFVQTLVQSCTTTKVDTYFGTEAAKEKNDPCSP